jgi:hypothetical protein
MMPSPCRRASILSFFHVAIVKPGYIGWHDKLGKKRKVKVKG